MKLPSILYGRYADVKKNCTKLATAVRKGATLIEAAGEEEKDLSKSSDQEFIVLEGPSPLLGGTNHFHVYLPLFTLFFHYNGKNKLIPEEKRGHIIEQALTLDWGVLSLISPINRLWYQDSKDIGSSLLKAVDVRSKEITWLGEKFSYGLPTPVSLWKIPTGVTYCLSVLGIDNDIIKNAYRTGTVPDLVREISRGN